MRNRGLGVGADFEDCHKRTGLLREIDSGHENETVGSRTRSLSMGSR